MPKRSREENEDFVTEAENLVRQANRSNGRRLDPLLITNAGMFGTAAAVADTRLSAPADQTPFNQRVPENKPR